MKTYDVLEVSRYIIAKGCCVSNLKLQSLLYFVQAYFLLDSDGKSGCFSEGIEAWDFGPVVPNVYYTFCTYGATPIFLKQKELPDLDWAAKMMIDGTLVLCGLMPWDWAREIKYVGGAWDIVYCSGNIGDPIPIDLIIEKG